MEKNIHFVVLGQTPDWALRNMERFLKLNPSWDIRIHDLNFALPDAYQGAMKTAGTVGAQSDILRIAALEVFGGWYFDWDVYPIRPIDETKTNELIGDRLFLWKQPGNSCYGSSICAASKDSVAWTSIHEVMDQIAKGMSPGKGCVEYQMCLQMRKFHSDVVTIGDPAEFTIHGNLLRDKAAYESLESGTWTGDTGKAAFIHGWSGLSRNPPLEVS